MTVSSKPDPPGIRGASCCGSCAGSWAATTATPTDDAAVFSSGAAAIDRLLPGGGLRHGMLVEWLAELPGCGAATLGLLAAREACRAGGVLVVLDRAQTFYPPAAVGWGIDPARLIVVRPRTARDEIVGGGAVAPLAGGGGGVGDDRPAR